MAKHKEQIKMYLVKREVMARNIREALVRKGKVYAVEIADDKFQPEQQVNAIGFNVKNEEE